MAHYVAAKHGLLGLTRGMAIELGPHAIRCNLVAPTTTDSPMVHNVEMQSLSPRSDAKEMTQERWEQMNRRQHLLPTPWIDPDDVAAVVAFLASDDARFVTGSTYEVDAGYTTR